MRADKLPFIDRQEIYLNMSLSAYFGPTPVKVAIPMIERAYQLVGGSLVSEAELRNARTGLLGMLGLVDESRAEARRANDLWDEVGGAGVTARQPLGEAEYYLGRFDLAEEIYREQAEQLTALGESGVNSTIRGQLALSLCYQAKFDEAEAQATMSRELAAEDDLASQASWRLAQAQVLSHREDFVAALALADEAVSIFGATDYISGQGEAHEVRGGILLAASGAPEAREAFAERS